MPDATDDRTTVGLGEFALWTADDPVALQSRAVSKGSGGGAAVLLENGAGDRLLAAVGGGTRPVAERAREMAGRFPGAGPLDSFDADRATVVGASAQRDGSGDAVAKAVAAGLREAGDGIEAEALAGQRTLGVGADGTRTEPEVDPAAVEPDDWSEFVFDQTASTRLENARGTDGPGPTAKTFGTGCHGEYKLTTVRAGEFMCASGDTDLFRPAATTDSGPVVVGSSDDGAVLLHLDADEAADAPAAVAAVSDSTDVDADDVRVFASERTEDAGSEAAAALVEAGYPVDGVTTQETVAVVDEATVVDPGYVGDNVPNRLPSGSEAERPAGVLYDRGFAVRREATVERRGGGHTVALPTRTGTEPVAAHEEGSPVAQFGEARLTDRMVRQSQPAQELPDSVDIDGFDAEAEVALVLAGATETAVRRGVPSSVAETLADDRPEWPVEQAYVVGAADAGGFDAVGAETDTDADGGPADLKDTGRPAIPGTRASAGGAEPNGVSRPDGVDRPGTASGEERSRIGAVVAEFLCQRTRTGERVVENGEARTPAERLAERTQAAFGLDADDVERVPPGAVEQDADRSEGPGGP